MDKCKHKNLFSDANTIAKLQATCKSRLLECEYFLKATSDYDSMLCCSSAPTIDIPLVVYIPNFSFDYNRFRPANWNPQVMPVYQINGPQIIDMNANTNANVNNFNNNQGNFVPMGGIQGGGSAPMMQGGSGPMMQGGYAPMMQG